MVVRLNDLQSGFKVINGELITLFRDLFGDHNSGSSTLGYLYVDISVKHIVVCSGVKLRGVELVAVFHDDKQLEFAIFLLPSEILELIRIDRPKSNSQTKKSRDLGQVFSTRRN